VREWKIKKNKLNSGLVDDNPQSPWELKKRIFRKERKII
jgi:hypothetical protein